MADDPTTLNPKAHRPRDLALLLVATVDDLPRFRQLLERIAANDPDPEALDTTLTSIVAELGEPTALTRAVCQRFRQEWDDCQRSPGAWSSLLSEAIGAAYREPRT
jgi:hypothetical protein